MTRSVINQFEVLEMDELVTPRLFYVKATRPRLVRTIDSQITDAYMYTLTIVLSLCPYTYGGVV